MTFWGHHRVRTDFPHSLSVTTECQSQSKMTQIMSRKTRTTNHCRWICCSIAFSDIQCNIKKSTHMKTNFLVLQHQSVPYVCHNEIHVFDFTPHPPTFFHKNYDFSTTNAINFKIFKCSLQTVHLLEGTGPMLVMLTFWRAVVEKQPSA